MSKRKIIDYNGALIRLNGRATQGPCPRCHADGALTQHGTFPDSDHLPRHYVTCSECNYEVVAIVGHECTLCVDWCKCDPKKRVPINPPPNYIDECLFCRKFIHSEDL